MYMLKYNFKIKRTELKDGDKTIVPEENVINYKCLICGYEHEYDETWTDEKKLEIKLEVDKHHNEHIIPDELTLSE